VTEAERIDLKDSLFFVATSSKNFNIFNDIFALYTT